MVSITNRPFWLGVIGCIIGLFLVFCGVILVLFVGVLSGISAGLGGSSANASSNMMVPWIMITLTGIFSTLGLIASLIDTKNMLGSILMIFAAIGISLSFFPFGFIPALFFLLGGILKLLDRKKMISPIIQQTVANENLK